MAETRMQTDLLILVILFFFFCSSLNFIKNRLLLNLFCLHFKNLVR